MAKEKTIENIAPIWKYVADDLQFENIADIHLILWSTGVSVAGFSSSGTPLVCQTYLTRERPGIEFISSLSSQEALLKGNRKKVKKIWLAEQRNILIPQKIYEGSRAESWIRKFHYLNPEEELLHFNQKEYIDGWIVFPISKELKRFFEKNFIKSETMSLSQAAFEGGENASEANNIELTLLSLPFEILLSLKNKGKITHFSIHSYDAPKDVVYKVALLLEDKGIARKELDKLKLTGIAPFWNNLLSEMADFFTTKTVSQNTTDITLDFLKKLYLCE